ncbi:hypothetical protein [Peribacillus simplex]
MYKKEEENSSLYRTDSKGDGNMNLRIKYRLYIHVDGKLIPEQYDRYEILNVREGVDPNDTKDYQELIKKLSKSINRPVDEFEIKNYETM